MGAFISFLVIAIVVLLILSSCIAGTGISRRASGCLSGDMVGWRAFQGAVH